MRPRVTYEFVLRASEAAFGRVGRALMEHHASLRDSHVSRGDWAIALVSIAPEYAEAFASLVKPIEWRYRSPTYFDNGTIAPCYASAQDELARVRTPEYVAFQLRRARETRQWVDVPERARERFMGELRDSMNVIESAIAIGMCDEASSLRYREDAIAIEAVRLLLERASDAAQADPAEATASRAQVEEGS